VQTNTHRLPYLTALGLALAITLGVPALVGCRQQASPSGPETQAAGGARMREIPKVRVFELERREMTQVLETMTKLESEREVELFPRTTGTVVELRVEEGDPVNEGDVLAVLDERDARLSERDAQVAFDEAKNTAELSVLAVAEARARMESAELTAIQTERDYDRNIKLFEGEEVVSSVSQSALEASRLERDRAQHDHRLAVLAHQKSQLDEKATQTAVERAALSLDRARLALSYCQIQAPFSGVIAERRIRVGDSASSAQAAFVLTDTENLRTVFFRPQEELSMFQGPANGHGSGTSLEVTATAEALPGEIFEGEVERISPTIDRDSGQFRVTARLHPEDASGGSRLLPGMLLRLEIVTDRHPEALVVPKRALRREGERRYILVIEPLPEDGEPPAEDETDEQYVAQEGTESDPAPAEAEKTRESESPEGESTAPERNEDIRKLRRMEVEGGYSNDELVEVFTLGDDVLEEGTPIVLVGSRDLDDGDLVDVGHEEKAPKTPDSEEGEAAAEATEVAERPEEGDGTDR